MSASAAWGGINFEEIFREVFFQEVTDPGIRLLPTSANIKISVVD
jgi:hypothetical protein